MKYELSKNSSKGVLIDRTPVLQDIRDTYRVSFVLPSKNAFVALFTGEDGIEHRAIIIDGGVKLPKQLLTREQYVTVIVSEVDNGSIVHAWECEPIKISAYLAMRRTQWQISGGADDKDCYARLATLEKLYAQTLEELKSLKADKASGDSQTNETVTMLSEQMTTIRELDNKITTTNQYSMELAELIKAIEARLDAIPPQKQYDNIL